METRSARPSPRSGNAPLDESFLPNRLRVLIADDEPEVREILISVVEADPGLELAGVAEDAEKAVEVARVTRPDVALLDVSMPGGGGVRAALGIGWRSPRTHMVALSLHDDRATIVDMIRAATSSAGGAPGRHIGRVVIDTDAREVYVDGVEVELTRLEFDLLETLTSRP